MIEHEFLRYMYTVSDAAEELMRTFNVQADGLGYKASTVCNSHTCSEKGNTTRGARINLLERLKKENFYL